MSYDKLDFTRPSENLKPHYHSSSTLRSSKSKEFGAAEKTRQNATATTADQESLTGSNEPLASCGYTQITILNDPSARKCSSGHLSQAAIPQVSTPI